MVDVSKRYVMPSADSAAGKRTKGSFPDLGFGIWDLGFGIWDLGFSSAALSTSLRATY
jgi:hypothetical protein